QGNAGRAVRRGRDSDEVVAADGRRGLRDRRRRLDRVTRHYLDHASTSPTRPVAIDAMTAALQDLAGDPGRIHAEGMAARGVVEHARDQVASFFGCRSSREVVFTSGATESIATAVFGAAGRGGHQVLTAVEHSAVRLAIAATGESTVV